MTAQPSAIEQSAEQTLFSCDHFGTVTNKRVIYERRSGFSGGSRVDIPLKHVTSVSLETSRSWLLFILLLLVAVSCLFAPHQGMYVRLIGAVAVASAALVYIGSPTIKVQTSSGKDGQPMSGQFWHRREASAFVEAIRAQLVEQ